MDKKSDLWGLVSELKTIIFGALLTIALIVAIFVAYLIWGNNSSTIDTTGVYNLVDSEGNVLATDLTLEDIDKIMEMLNGEGKGN